MLIILKKVCGNYTEEGLMTRDQYKILKEQVKFYRKLYRSNPEIKFSSENLSDSRVTLADRDQLEQPLTLEELKIALNNLPNQKMPGCNSLSSEFYQFFWDDLKELLINSFNYAFKNDKLFPPEGELLL